MPDAPPTMTAFLSLISMELLDLRFDVRPAVDRP
jgi:hypothetical protein